MVNNGTAGASGALNGSKTAENLKRAFGREAETFARNSIYADIASQEGNVSALRILNEMADNDKRHAELWLGYLDELGDTLENIDNLYSLKSEAAEEFYEEIADVADDEGFWEIAEKLRLVSSVKNTHAGLLDEEASKIQNGVPAADNPETPWTCESCGYIVKGNMPPERCPLCGFPAYFFAR